MATFKEVADRMAELRAKIELIQDLLSWGYSPDSHLKEQYGELVHDKVMNELDEGWLSPLTVELTQLENLEIDYGDDGTDRRKGHKARPKKKEVKKRTSKGKG